MGRWGDIVVTPGARIEVCIIQIIKPGLILFLTPFYGVGIWVSAFYIIYVMAVKGVLLQNHRNFYSFHQ